MASTFPPKSWYHGGSAEEDPTESGALSLPQGLLSQIINGTSCQPCISCAADRLGVLLTQLDTLVWDPGYAFDARLYIYKQLKDSLQIMYSGSAHDIELQNFFSVMALNNVHAFSTVEELLANNEYASAKLMNDGISYDLLMEENGIIVNQICAKYEQDFQLLDSTDYSSLEQIAYQHPLIGGIAVYRARAILGIDVDDTQLAFREHSNAITESDINYITLTPNPSSGRFLVQLLNTDDAISQIMVFNFYGQLISCEGKQLNNHDYLLNLKGYSPGVYYVNVKLTSSKEIVKKLTLVNEK